MQTMQALIASMVIEGVFEKFPELQIVLIEGGFTWEPAFVRWRLDSTGALQERGAAPEARPVGIRDRAFPLHDAADRTSRKIRATCVTLSTGSGSSGLMFSTDYPHWDFDDPRYALNHLGLSEAEKTKIFNGNAKGFYGLQ